MATTNDPLSEVGEVPDKLPPPGDKNRERKPGKRGHSPIYWMLFFAALVLAAVVVFFVGWLPRHKRKETIDKQAQQESQARPRINVAKVDYASATSSLAIPGTALAYTEAYIYARASGYVTKRFVDIGDRVHAGQLLATIDSPDLDQQVLQARSTLEQSQSNVVQLEAQLHLQAVNNDRFKVLVAKGVFSRQQGDEQEANFRVAEANVRAAQNSIQANRDALKRLVVLQEYENVRAPFSGVVTARNVDVGTLINAQGNGSGNSTSAAPPGTTQAGAQGNNEGASGSLSTPGAPTTGGSQGGQMFGIADIARLRVLVSIPEAYAGTVKVGQRATLAFQEAPDERIEGHVTRTSSSIDQNTRTLLVEVGVSNPGGRLLPGMYVVVTFADVKGQPPLLIPGEAIVIRNAKTVVGVVKDDTVHFRPISIGRDYGDQTEITSGIQAGDVIATTVTDEVQEGGKIDPQFPKQKQQQAGQQEQAAGTDNTQQTSNAGEPGKYGPQAKVDAAQKASQGGGQKGGGGKGDGGKDGGKGGKSNSAGGKDQ